MEGGADPDVDAVDDAGSDLAATDDAADERDGADDPALESAQVTFDFGKWTIPPGGEQYPCAQWTLDNDQPLYVKAVIKSNDGGWHHSNWYAVDENRFSGPDGIHDCSDRRFNEREGAIYGAVVFAQSTQAYVERQEFEDGVVIKIPPRSKIIGGVHLLNVSTSELETGARMGLELVHPKDVEQVAVPWRLDNSALVIPSESEVRFESTCSLAAQYEQKTGEPFEPKIFWILPHYHQLGNYFRVDVVRPDGDETIVELEGFNAEANGITFDPPVDLTGATGLRFVCGYYNPFPYTTRYGLTGEDEMCTLLAFTNSSMRLNTSVFDIDSVATVDGIEHRYGPCNPLFLPNTVDQAMPTQEEIDAPLYVPESNTAGGGDTPLIPECGDTPADAEPDGPATLSALRVDVFGASCAFSSCHDVDSPAGGIDFTAEDLHTELLEHDLLTDAGMPLVDPGNPDNSWLYRVTSSCSPEAASGVMPFMPRNSPTLLPAGKVARIRAWIEAGALDD